MRNPKPKSKPLFLPFFILSIASLVSSKSTIEPCSNSDSCNAMVGYTLYTDLKVSEVSSLFQIDPISLLTANSIDPSYPDVENHILPSQLFLKLPIICSCLDGIRKSVSIHYNTRPSDTLASIAGSVFGGLLSSDQLREANSIADASVIDVGQTLVVPLPCVCFNNTDNLLPAIYMSYVVRSVDTLAGIADKFETTVTDLMNVNAMASSDVDPADILSIPLSACASNFPSFSSDYGLIVQNGSFAITANHCVQCSCDARTRNLYCMPASLSVSCSSMQCEGSNLMLGNSTTEQSSAGCSVTSCSYSGFVNDTIITALSASLQPRCPGPQEFPTVIAPPTTSTVYSSRSSPSLSQPGTTVPRSNGTALSPLDSFKSTPTASIASGCSLINPFPPFQLLMFALCALVFCFVAPCDL